MLNRPSRKPVVMSGTVSGLVTEINYIGRTRKELHELATDLAYIA